MAGLCALESCHLITCTAHLSIELWKMRYINDCKINKSGGPCSGQHNDLGGNVQEAIYGNAEA